MSFNSDLCSGCPMEGMYEPSMARGDADARFLVVSDTPTQLAAKEGRLMTRLQMNVFGAKMEEVGFAAKDFRFAPACHCAYDPDAHVNKVKTATHKHCRQHFLREVEAHNYEAVVPLGAPATSQAFGKPTKITKVRGIVTQSEELGIPIFPLMSPALVVMYPQNEPVFTADIASFSRSVGAGYDVALAASQQIGEYQIVTDLQFLIDLDPEILAFDTENTGLRWYQSGTNVRNYKPQLHKGKVFFKPKFQILTMQFCVEPGKGYMLVWDHPENPIPEQDKPKLRNQLRQLLCKEDRIVVAQGAKYDNVSLWMTEGIRFRIGGDTLMMATLLDENMPERNLDILTKIHAPEMGGYADCVHPDTMLLLEDLTKKRAAEVVAGDALVGFEEFATNGASRKMVATVVESTRALQMPSYVITMEGGQKIQVSKNHQFLRGPVRESSGGSWVWRRADELKVGDRLKLFPFPEAGSSFQDGWMAGILDGEGYVTQQGDAGMKLGFCQLEGQVLTEGMRLFNNGEDLQVSWDSRKRLANVTISGARAMNELIRLRPRRLIAKKPWQGKALFVGKSTQGRIKSIEFVGRCNVVSIQTSSHTFIANGFATHNCFNAAHDKSRMWEVSLSELRGYGIGDADAAFRVYHTLEEKIAEDGRLWAHYCNVTIPGLNAFAAMETRGMFIDEGEALAQFKTLMISEVARMEKELLEAIPRSCKQSIVQEYLGRRGSKGQLVNKSKTAEDALSFSRGDFIKQVLFIHPKGFRLKPKVFTKTTAKLKDESLREPSTSAKDHLPYFFDTCPFTMQLAEYQKDQHLLNNNVLRYEENYIRGGKVRPTYHLHKAVTGRSSSEDPNGQNTPKRGARAKVYRKAFVAPEGYYVIEADQSQAEVRIAACMSGDKTLIDIYRRGADVHRATALIVAGLNEAEFNALPRELQKEYRQKAKAVVFGFLYGMGWRKFIGYAKTQYGVEFTEVEAQRIRKDFFAKYRSLAAWHEAMREFAAENKFVRSFSGRVRHLPMIDSSEDFIQQEAGRQAINSPVQEFGSSLGVMSLGRMNEEVNPEYLSFVGFIHDAIVVYVKKEHLDWGMRTVKHYMQSNPITEWFGTTLKVPLVADVSFGPNLGEVYECEGFSLDAPFDYTVFKDKDGVLEIEVPPQEVPPNDGRLTRSIYTLPTDLEDENIQVKVSRARVVRAGINKTTVMRIERSQKQMVINRRNRVIKEELKRERRMGQVLRRTKTPQ